LGELDIETSIEAEKAIQKKNRNVYIVEFVIVFGGNEGEL